MLAEINPVTASKEHSQFAQTITYGFAISIISVLQSNQASEDALASHHIAEPVKPIGERFVAIPCCVDDYMFGLRFTGNA